MIGQPRHSVELVRLKATMQLQPTRINRILNSCLVLVGCWLLPLMVQAQGHENPKWWRNISNDDPHYTIGYGSALTPDNAWIAAAKEIARQVGKTQIKTKDGCIEIQQGGMSKAEEYTKNCASEVEASTDQTLFGLTIIKQGTATRIVTAPVASQDNHRRKRKNRGKSPAKLPTKEQTTHYIALGYDNADLIGKIARVINSSDNPQKYCINPAPSPFVPFDQQLQDHPDVADNCVIKWRLTHQQGEKADSHQWMLITLAQSWSITLAELRQLFWPIPGVSSSEWLKLTIPSPLYYGEWVEVDIAATHPVAWLPANSLEQYRLSLFLVDQAGRVTIMPMFNNKPVKSGAWAEQFELSASPTPGQPDSQSHELIVAALCKPQTAWPTIFPASGETVATGEPRFDELIAAIKSQKQKGLCHVATKPYLAQPKK